MSRSLQLVAAVSSENAGRPDAATASDQFSSIFLADNVRKSSSVGASGACSISVHCDLIEIIKQLTRKNDKSRKLAEFGFAHIYPL